MLFGAQPARLKRDKGFRYIVYLTGLKSEETL